MGRSDDVHAERSKLPGATHEGHRPDSVDAVAPAAPIESAAQRLAEAYSRRTALGGPDALGDATPTTLAEGYAVQQRMRQLAGLGPGAWKVGATTPAAQQMLRIDAPFLGRPDGDRVLDTGAIVVVDDWFVGLQAIEMEVGLRPLIDLTDLPDDPLELADVVDVVPCIEIVDFRFGSIAGLSAPSVVADNGVAAALVVGVPLALEADGVRALDTIDVELSVRGVDPLPEPVRGDGALALGHPLRSLHVAAQLALDLGTPIRLGEIVSTGTCTGMQRAPAGMAATGRVGASEVSVEFV